MRSELKKYLKSRKNPEAYRKYLKSRKNPEARKIPEKLQYSRTFLENPEDLATLHTDHLGSCWNFTTFLSPQNFVTIQVE